VDAALVERGTDGTDVSPRSSAAQASKAGRRTYTLSDFERSGSGRVASPFLDGSTKNAVNLLNPSAVRHGRTTIRSHERNRRPAVGKLGFTVNSVNRPGTVGRQV
jgi:hypothetical protein